MVGEKSANLWIKGLRSSLDLTQEELAECVGCSAVTIQKIESGERRPSKQIAEKLAMCLRIPPEGQEAFISSAREGQSTSSSHLAHSPSWHTPPDQATPTNLPSPLTRLVGREPVAAEARNYLLREDVRLLTLTGAPGIGKTRLSLQVAAELLGEFTDGVFLIELATVNDPDLVAPTIAGTLGLKETASHSILDGLKQFLMYKKVLLVLDNFEQVLDAAPVVVALLTTCAQLKLLVTSREALHAMGEQQFPVPPLQIPDLSHLPNLQSLPDFPAVELFMQRASATDPGFQLTEENSGTVAAICVRLEGLPLAIELAAARIKLLSPREMLARLDRQLGLLTSTTRFGHAQGHRTVSTGQGSRSLVTQFRPLRHQTMRLAVDWSYQLLDTGEQTLLSRLGVFVGGWTLQAAEAVCSSNVDPTMDVPAGIESLLEKSLLRRSDGRDGSRHRFMMLEVVREYALESLAANGDQEAARCAHALFFLRLAEEADMKMWGPEDLIWLALLDEEHDNMRAALQWSKSINGDLEIELRLVVALGRFWEMRGHLSEGRERIASVLSRPETEGEKLKHLRAWALVQMGALAFWQSEYPAARSAWEEALRIFEELGEMPGVARVLTDLGDLAREVRDYDTSVLLISQAIAMNRELGDRQGMAVSLALLGWAEMRPGYFSQATTHLQESLAIARQIEKPSRIALALSALGESMVRQGMQDQAVTVLQESLEIRRRAGYRWGIAASLGTLGWVALRRGDYEQATEMLKESIEIREELEDKGGVAWCLEKFAEIEAARGRPLRAARLLGAATALRQTIGTTVDIADQPDYERIVNAIRAGLGGEAFVKASEEGRTMTFEQVIAHALVADPGGSISVTDIPNVGETATTGGIS